MTRLFIALGNGSIDFQANWFLAADDQAGVPTEMAGKMKALERGGRELRTPPIAAALSR